jgi:surface antigen
VFACALVVVVALVARVAPSGSTPGVTSARGGLALASSGLPFTMLCQGFTDCANKGYSDADYGVKSNYNTMYWNMYSGSNCVNYVAYRMILGGMPSERPAELKPGKGNAEYWGTSFPTLTNTTPTVGSVAWWRGGATGAGAEGHVAYVEKVIAPDDIIVSESNWGSPFDWREITGPTDWPSGFIHFQDKQVQATVAPTLPTTTPTVGVAMRATAGHWSPKAKVSYQWMVGGTTVGTSKTYTPDPTLHGKKVSVVVTASAKSYNSTSVTLDAPTAIARGTFAQAAAPVIGGTAQATLPLTLDDGQFGPTPISETVQWYADGEPVTGATSSTYVPTVDQIGQEISARIVVHHVGYVPMTVDTTPTAAVLGKPFRVSGGSVTGTVVRDGTLIANAGTFTDPVDATPTYQWEIDGTPIPGATSATYHPTTAQVGHHLSVLVAASESLYADYTKTYAEGAVGTQGQLAVSAVGKSRAVRVHVRMGAPGMDRDELNRTVTVAIGSAKSVNLRLKDGVGTAVLTDVRPGQRTVSVTWGGSSLISAARASVTTKVLTPAQSAQQKATSADVKPSTSTSKATTSKTTTSTTTSRSTKATAGPSSTPTSTPTAKATAKATTSAKASASAKPSSSATASATKTATSGKK